MTGFLDDALVCFERSLKAKPDRFQAYNNVGIPYQARGTSRPQSWHTRRRLRSPGYAEAHVNSRNVLQQMGNWGQSIECYEPALALRPDLAEAACNLGNVLKAMKRQDDAVPYYRGAVALKPGFAPAYLALARALQEMGDRAIAAFRRAGNPISRKVPKLAFVVRPSRAVSIARSISGSSGHAR